MSTICFLITFKCVVEAWRTNEIHHCETAIVLDIIYIITITTTRTKCRIEFFDNFPIYLYIIILDERLISGIFFDTFCQREWKYKKKKYVFKYFYSNEKMFRHYLQDCITCTTKQSLSGPVHEAQSFFWLFFLSKGEIKVSFGTLVTFARMCVCLCLNVKPSPRPPR